MSAMQGRMARMHLCEGWWPAMQGLELCPVPACSLDAHGPLHLFLFSPLISLPLDDAGLRHENDFVGVQANKDDTVDFIKGSKKNVGKPAKAATHYKWKQNARRSLVSVGKQVASMRPDLKVRR
eukprot:1161928-Pelagomonas_calceolata.AAC.11